MLPLYIHPIDTRTATNIQSLTFNLLNSSYGHQDTQELSITSISPCIFILLTPGQSGTFNQKHFPLVYSHPTKIYQFLLYVLFEEIIINPTCTEEFFKRCVLGTGRGWDRYIKSLNNSNIRNFSPSSDIFEIRIL